MEYLSTFAPNLSPSFVGFYIPAPWFASGIGCPLIFHGLVEGAMGGAWILVWAWGVKGWLRAENLA